jgi:hypothetical protein
MEVFNRPNKDQDKLFNDWQILMNGGMQVICDFLFDIRLKKFQVTH